MYIEHPAPVLRFTEDDSLELLRTGQIVCNIPDDLQPTKVMDIAQDFFCSDPRFEDARLEFRVKGYKNRTLTVTFLGVETHHYTYPIMNNNLRTFFELLDNRQKTYGF